MKRFLTILSFLSACSLDAHANIDRKDHKPLSLTHLEKLSPLEMTRLFPEQKLKLVRMALQQPNKESLRLLKKMPWAVKSMTQLALNPEVKIEERWSSLISIGRLAPQSPFLEQAVQHTEWFMRNAALLALTQGPRDRALRWSRKLLDDPALVVRTAAVKTIRRLKANEMESLLWKDLNSPKNFKKGESLWIRKHIVETLGDFSRPGQEPQFIKLLKDPDPRVHAAAIKALEKITGMQFTGSNTTIQRKAWLFWWNQKTPSSSVDIK